MNIEQLAGSCIMTGIRGAELDDPRCREDVALLKKLHIKNVILFDVHLPTGGLRNIVSEDQVRRLTDDLRNELGDDLVIGIDQEGGEVNRLTNFQDPAVASMLSAKMQGAMSEMQLAAVIDPVAQAISEAGINLTFAPCVDLAINPDNPIIAGKGRSLGTDPKRVGRAASTIIKSYHTHGVRCCIKHFPGHGSTSVDTHLGLADISKSYSSIEHEVFESLISSMNSGAVPLSGVMTGHLINQHIDPNSPASLSSSHTTQCLRDELGFDGVVFTDSIDMGAIRTQFSSGQASSLSIGAGADIVIDGFNAPDPIEHPAQMIHESIMQAVKDGVLSEARLLESIQRREQLLPT
jgi:beta-N-acetylhexosaminidase